MPIENPTRRERLRGQAIEEIKHHAIEQVAAGGAQALSLSAIGKAMGMSGPAIYRYFSSREELLAALVTDGYGELGDVVREAAGTSKRSSPARRLARVGEAYRAWALANPYLYELLFSVRPEGYSDPEEAKNAFEPAMGVLLELVGLIVADSRTDGSGLPHPGPALKAQLRSWAGREESRQVADASAIHLLCILAWTRIHGIISLELAGVFGDVEIDAGLLTQAEITAIVAAASK